MGGVTLAACSRARGARLHELLIGVYGRGVRVGGVISFNVHFEIANLSVRVYKYQYF